MAGYRFWRIVGLSLNSNGPLELTEARLFAGATSDVAATLTCTAEPTDGELADLRDGDTDVAVAWSAAQHTRPGFALVWDFGPGVTFEVTAMRLGSAASVATWPLTLSLQHADDGATWGVLATPYAVTYPGPFSLTAEPSGGSGEVPDPLESFVTFDVPGLVDFGDKKGNAVTVVGGAVVIDKKMVFGAGTQYARYSNASGAFTVAASTPFLLEMFIASDFSNNNYELLADITNDGSASNGWFLECSRQRGLVWSTSSFGFVWAGLVHDSVERHVCVGRDSTGRLFLGVDGFIRATLSNSSYLGAGNGFFGLANYNGGRYPNSWQGKMRGVKFIKGESRYGGSVGTAYDIPLPPSAGGTSAVIPTDEVPPKRWRLLTDGVAKAAGEEFDAPPLAELMSSPTLFLDALDGGPGTIYGTVKEKHTPDNAPLYRRVLLIDERSRLTIRETWSDPVTGKFEFRGVRSGVKYTVISYDHLDNFRAVLANGLGAEVPA